MAADLNLSPLRRGVVVDAAIALSFVVLDTAVTLAGGSWWPAHPNGLAWALLAAQGLTCLSLVARRRAPLAVVGVFAAFTLAVTCLGEGLSNAQIAARLFLSEATIKGYVSRMLDKLGCANRTQAGLLAHDAGIADT